MQAATPTITPEELVKRMADAETYPSGSIALLGKVRTMASCPCSYVLALFTSITSRLSDKLLRRHAKVA